MKNVEKLRERYEPELKERGLTGVNQSAFEARRGIHEDSIAKSVAVVIGALSPAFTILGPDPNTKSTAVAAHCVAHCDCNFVLCKY